MSIRALLPAACGLCAVWALSAEVGAQNGTAPAGTRAAPQSASYDYRFTISGQTLEWSGATRSESEVIARVRTRGTIARVDLPLRTGIETSPGDWYLTRDLGRTITVVDTKAKRYREVSTVGLREALGREKGLDVTVHDLSISVQPPVACGAVDGWRTQCVTIVRRYTARTRYWIMSHDTQVDETTRVWLAPALPDLVVPFGSFFGTRTELLVRRDSLYIARERDAGAAFRIGGMIRMEVSHTETTGRARVHSRRVLSVSDIRPLTGDDLLFEVPPGYRLQRQ